MNTSIIILNWNGRHHLSECLPELARQVCPDDEVIVVDNGSTLDDSVSYVRAIFPWVILVAVPHNLGFSGGNKAGLAAAKGDFVVLLNNDTCPAPDWLLQMKLCATQHRGVGIIASHLVDWDGRLSDSAGDGCRVTGRGYGRNRGNLAVDAPSSGPVFGACAGAALYRRTLIDDVGFLDEDFFLNFEDSDLAFRARLRGWQIWFCREAIVRHRVSASQGAWSAANTYFGARNHLWVCIKNMPAWLLIKYAPITLIEIIAMACSAARRGKLAAYTRGLWRGILGIPRMMSKRRSIQKTRKLTSRELETWLTRPSFSWSAFSRIMRV